MNQPAAPQQFDVALVSMPWNIEQFTSLQIATLKSYLVKQGVSATRHYHKDLLDYVGGEERHHVHEYGYGEHLFGALYYPDRRSDFVEAIKRRFDTPPLEPLLDRLHTYCEDVVRDLLATGAGLVGFTTTHVQVMSSIYIARGSRRSGPGSRWCSADSRCSSSSPRACWSSTPRSTSS
ncbi:hypothetical protein ACFQ0T_01075 [Kitasatospora gansuensis]